MYDCVYVYQSINQSINISIYVNINLSTCTFPTSEALWPERALGGLPEMAGGYLVEGEESRYERRDV